MDNAPILEPAEFTPPQPRTGPLLLISCLIFLIIGVLLGLLFASRYPELNIFPAQITTTPPLLSPTPTSSSTMQTITNDFSGYRVLIPGDWIRIESENSLREQDQFQATDGSILNILVIDSATESLTDFLAKQDETDSTSWEGKPGRKVLTSEKTTVSGLPAVERTEEWLAADFTTINTYTLVNGKVISFYIVPLEIPYKQTKIFTFYQDVLDSFEPLSTP